MKRKRILFITLFLSEGGAERTVSILSSELAKRGLDVHLILFDRYPKEYALAREVKLHELRAPEGWCRLDSICKKVGRMRKIIKEIAPDIIIPFLAIPTFYAYLASRGLKNCTFISTVRNNPLLYPESALKRNVVNLITKKSDKIMLQTPEQEMYFPHKLSSKIFVIPNPVKQEILDTVYECRPEVKRIIAIGRFFKQKNHSLLIRAFGKLSEKWKDLRLVIYGEGGERKNLEKLIKELRLTKRVHLPGKIANVHEALAKGDVFVLSSDYEGLPNTLIEAMAVGLPCISTACPTGPRDLIQNGRDGLLVRVGDEAGLAGAMEHLIQNFEVRQRLGTAARKKIQKKFETSKVVDLFEEQVLK